MVIRSSKCYTEVAHSQLDTPISFDMHPYKDSSAPSTASAGMTSPTRTNATSDDELLIPGISDDEVFNDYE